jgi:hypothetical protein
MSLWGNKDLVGNAGTITINLANEQITGSGTTFVTAGHVVSEGDVIVVGAGATYGHAVINTVTSNTIASVATTQYLIPNPTTGLIPTGTPYYITQRPIYSLEDVNYQAPVAKANRTSSVFGVDAQEVGTASTIAVGGKAAAYAVAHSGWVGVTTYVDTHGNLRVKSEVLVAGGIEFARNVDAADDAKFPDPTINITTNVVDAVGVTTNGNATFTVVASVNPTYAPLTYQWYEDTTELSDGGDYSGATTTVLTVANDSDKDDGREYKVVIASGDTSVVSAAGTITYA